jgi:formylglycine-generating enzyme
MKNVAQSGESLRVSHPLVENMVRIPGGTFLMGSDKHYPEEAPAHEVTVDGFWIDKYTVTNDQFLTFVQATKYVTSAERPAKAEDILARNRSCWCRLR